MKQTFRSRFPIIVWISTIISAPFLFVVSANAFINDGSRNSSQYFGLIFYMILFGTFCSLPSLLIYWLTYDHLNDKPFVTKTKKIVLSISGFVLVILTFGVFYLIGDGELDLSSILLLSSYSLATIFFTLAIKMTK